MSLNSKHMSQNVFLNKSSIGALNFKVCKHCKMHNSFNFQTNSYANPRIKNETDMADNGQKYLKFVFQEEEKYKTEKEE